MKKKIAIIIAAAFTLGQIILPTVSTYAETIEKVVTKESVTDSNVTDTTITPEENVGGSNVEGEKPQTDSNVEEETPKIESDAQDKKPEVDESVEQKKEEVTTEKSESVEAEEKEETRTEETRTEEKSNTYEKVKKPIISAFTAQGTDFHMEKKEFADDIAQISEIEYLVPMTDSKYEVAIANNDGSYDYLTSSNSYDEAIEAAKNYGKIAKSNDTIPVVINEDGQVVYSTNAMGRIVKHINGKPYGGSDKNTNIYYNSSLSGDYIYVNHGYVDDVPVIEDRGNVAKIQVGGYTGWVNKNVNASEYDLIIVPMNQVKNPSYFQVSNGVLKQFISTDITSTTQKGYTRNIGAAPKYLKSGVKYYSYDNKYFYTDLNVLINDLKAGNNYKAVNTGDPLYLYFLNLPFRSKTNYSSSELDNFIAANTESESALRGSGQVFIDAQDKYGVNAVLMLGIAINESGWGMSSLARNKNNIFGLAAYDSNPNDANAYRSISHCIDEFANIWMSKGYADPQDWRFYGGYLGDKSYGANVKYASDPFWGGKAAAYAYQIDKALGSKDYDSNIIGVFSAPTEVMFKSGTTIYDIKNGKTTNSGIVGVPVILNSTQKQNVNGRECYSINPDRTTSLAVSGGSEFGGVYDWKTKGYVKSDTIRIVNNAKSVTQGIAYQTHVQNVGWQEWKRNGQVSGTSGQSLRLEGIKINLEGFPEGTTVRYKTHVQNEGWQNWKNEGEFSGSQGKSQRLEAIVIEGINIPEGYNLVYRVHIQNEGWQGWKRSGQVAGTSGKSLRLEAIEIKLIKDLPDKVSYRTHVQYDGWKPYVSNGQMSGTSGQSKRLEGIQISLNETIPGASIKYRTHVQYDGWQGWRKDGEMSGTSGRSLRLEGIQIELENAPEGYSVEYRTHIQNLGWQEWKRDGQVAGTTGKALRLEAIEIRIVKN